MTEPPSLFYFCIYRTKPLTTSKTVDLEETGGMEILYFHPNTFTRNEQLRHCGLGQALVSFTE